MPPASSTGVPAGVIFFAGTEVGGTAWVPHPSLLAKVGGQTRFLRRNAVYPSPNLAAQRWGTRCSSPEWAKERSPRRKPWDNVCSNPRKSRRDDTSIPDTVYQTQIHEALKTTFVSPLMGLGLFVRPLPAACAAGY